MSSNDDQNTVNENRQDEGETTPEFLNSGPEESPPTSATKSNESLKENTADGMVGEKAAEPEQEEKKKRQYKEMEEEHNTTR